MSKSYLITDYGTNYVLINKETMEELVLERYGVWKVVGNTMVEVVEVSDDLEYLKEKYETQDVLDLAKCKAK